MRPLTFIGEPSHPKFGHVYVAYNFGESQRKSSGRISNYNNYEQWYEKQAGAR